MGIPRLGAGPEFGAGDKGRVGMDGWAGDIQDKPRMGKGCLKTHHLWLWAARLLLHVQPHGPCHQH